MYMNFYKMVIGSIAVSLITGVCPIVQNRSLVKTANWSTQVNGDLPPDPTITANGILAKRC